MRESWIQFRYRWLARLIRISLVLWLMTIGQVAQALEAVSVSGDLGKLSLRPFVEVLVDVDAQLTIDKLVSPENAEKFAVIPGQTELNFGYSSAVYWLRFRLKGVENSQEQLHVLLELAYPSLDRVELYQRDGDSWQVLRSGDLQPFSKRLWKHRNLVFPIVLSTAEPRDYILRVESQGSLTLPLTLWALDALQSHDHESYSLHAFYFGMLFAIGAYNLLLMLSLRDRLTFYYVVCVFWMAVAQASMYGLGNQFLWPEWPVFGNAALPMAYCLTGLMGGFFTRTFLETKRFYPCFDRVIALLQVGFLVTAVAAFFIYRPAAIATALVGSLFSILSVWCAVKAFYRRQGGAGVFLLAWGLLLLGVAVLGMRTLNWLPTNLLTMHSMQIGSAIEMLLLSFALAERIHTGRREKDLAQQEALRLRTEMLEQVQRSERQLEARVEQRTAELADANRRLSDMATHDGLTGLANRSLLEQHLSWVFARARRTGERFCVLMLDLDRFKPVNDRYGHAAGDLVLKTVAARLLAVVREMDLVARVGGDEFVIVVNGVLLDTTLRQLGEKLLDSIGETISLDQAKVSVGASIGAAEWRVQDVSVDDMLRRADEAMYEAKAAGRGCCVYALDVG